VKRSEGSKVQGVLQASVTRSDSRPRVSTVIRSRRQDFARQLQQSGKCGPMLVAITTRIPCSSSCCIACWNQTRRRLGRVGCTPDALNHHLKLSVFRTAFSLSVSLTRRLFGEACLCLEFGAAHLGFEAFRSGLPNHACDQSLT
jgi:hypothetical protein